MNVEDIFFDVSYFKIRKLISKGNFADYYIAKNQENLTKHAAKIYITDEPISWSDQIDVLREAMILNKLQHPSIIKFYGVNFQSFQDPMQIKPSILLEYHPNGSLRKLLDKERRGICPTEWTLTKKYINILGISHAMNHIHQQGIIHRNLKPENILLDKNYYPIVSDFILARIFPFELNKTIKIPLQNAVGTPLYMAPEMTFKDDFYGVGVDVYAFAMIAYELLTGKMPGYETGLNFSILRVDRPFYRPRFDKNVSVKMKELIIKCLDSWPDDRPTFDEIYNELSTDFSYFCGDFDRQEIENFINLIEGKSSNSDESSNSTSKDQFELNVDDDCYQSICQISDGEFAKSFKIVNKETKKPLFKYVMKVKCGDVQSLLKEFKFLHSLKHPCVCQLLGMNLANNDEVSFYNEFVDFKLADCLKFSIINSTLKMRIVVEILHGLMFLNRNGLVYRNFDINSIMLNSIFNAKIIRFESARINQFLLNDEHLNAFRSPEELSTDVYDFKSVVYSFGVVLYCILVGDSSMRIDEVFKFLSSCSNDDDSSIPKCGIELISKCLSENPRNRPTFEDILNNLRENDFLLLSDVDPSIVIERDKELDLL